MDLPDALVDIVDRGQILVAVARERNDCCSAPEPVSRFERDGQTLLMCSHHAAQHWLKLTADGWIAYRLLKITG